MAEILQLLDAGGCTAPIGLEVTSVELAARPPHDVVAELAAAVRVVRSPTDRR